MDARDRSHETARVESGSSDQGGAYTATAYVVESGGPCNVYQWDEERRILTLRAVQRPTSPRAADLARIPLLPALRSEHANGDRNWAIDLAASAQESNSVAAGPALLALVLAEPSLAPDTRLTVRFLGALPLSSSSSSENDGSRHDASTRLGHWIAIVVPTLDDALASQVDLTRLPTSLHERLSKAYDSLRHPGIELDQALAAASTSRDIFELFQEAAAETRSAQRAMSTEQPSERLFENRDAERRRRIPGASGVDDLPNVATNWRELSHVSPADLLARGEAAYSVADHLLRWIPARFERYLAELLVPDERVLFFAECPPLTLRGWTGEPPNIGSRTSLDKPRTAARPRRGSLLDRFKTRRLHAGLLLITDRQLLLLRDYAPPDSALVEWGYLAQSWSLHRVVGVSLVKPGHTLDSTALSPWPLRLRERIAGLADFDEASVPITFARLVFALEAANGIQVAGVAFPANAAPVLARALEMVEGFLPYPGAAGAADRRLRNAPHATAWKPTEREADALRTLGGMVLPAVAEMLTQATAATIAEDEDVLTQARTPQLGESASATAALMTLTSRRLILATTGARPSTRQNVDVRAIPLGEISGVALQHSLLGSGLIFTKPTSAGIEVTRIAFPSPVIVPFRALFNRLRLLLLGGCANS